MNFPGIDRWRSRCRFFVDVEGEDQLGKITGWDRSAVVDQQNKAIQ
jgi:hypothetical protein